MSEIEVLSKGIERDIPKLFAAYFLLESEEIKENSTLSEKS
jgi:hypothetical protein